MAFGVCTCGEKRGKHRFNEDKKCLTFVRKHRESQGGTGSEKEGDSKSLTGEMGCGGWGRSCSAVKRHILFL